MGRNRVSFEGVGGGLKQMPGHSGRVRGSPNAAAEGVTLDGRGRGEVDRGQSEKYVKGKNAQPWRSTWGMRESEF